MRLALAAVALAGCGFVAGLHHLPEPEPDAPPVPPVVTGHLHELYLTNDATFAPQVNEHIYPPGTVAFAAFLDDGTQPAVAYAADGTFSFPLARADQTYRLVFTTDGNRNELQTSATTLALQTAVAGRLDRQPITPTNLQFGYPLSSGANLGAHIATTGVYTFTYTGQYGPTVTFDWRLAGPALGGAVGMLDASKHDRAYVLEYVGDSTTIPGTTWYAISAASSAAITQMANTTAVLPTPQPVARNGCARFAAPDLAETGRIMTAVPRSYASTSGNWLVYMAPAADALGMVGAQWVALSGFSPALDLDISPSFHDPYVNSTVVVEAGAFATYPVQLPGSTTALQLSNASVRYQKVDRGNPAACLSPKATLDAHVGIPGAFVLDGYALDTDGRDVPLELGRDVPLTWSLVAAGTAYTYSVSVLELVIANGATVSIPRLAFTVTGTAARIDASFLQPGSTYTIAITASTARPRAAQGDFDTLAFPIESATTWSPYFRVVARPASIQPWTR